MILEEIKCRKNIIKNLPTLLIFFNVHFFVLSKKRTKETASPFSDFIDRRNNFISTLDKQKTELRPADVA